jgi:hypothetical protein
MTPETKLAIIVAVTRPWWALRYIFGNLPTRWKLARLTHRSFIPMAWQGWIDVVLLGYELALDREEHRSRLREPERWRCK